MNIYKIARNDTWDYDDYDSAVVVAATEDDARNIHPNGSGNIHDRSFGHRSWVSDPLQVAVTLIGVAVDGIEPGVVVASFNAG